LNGQSNLNTLLVSKRANSFHLGNEDQFFVIHDITGNEIQVFDSKNFDKVSGLKLDSSTHVSKEGQYLEFRISKKSIITDARLQPIFEVENETVTIEKDFIHSRSDSTTTFYDLSFNRKFKINEKLHTIRKIGTNFLGEKYRSFKCVVIDKNGSILNDDFPFRSWYSNDSLIILTTLEGTSTHVVDNRLNSVVDSSINIEDFKVYKTAIKIQAGPTIDSSTTILFNDGTKKNN
jgi:hypothetical protein